MTLCLLSVPSNEVLAQWVGGPASRLLVASVWTATVLFRVRRGSWCRLVVVLLLWSLLHVVRKFGNAMIALSVAKSAVILLEAAVVRCKAAAVIPVLATREVTACPYMSLHRVSLLRPILLEIRLGAWKELLVGWTVLRVLRVPPIPCLHPCGRVDMRLLLHRLCVRCWVVLTVALDKAAELACTQATQLCLHSFRVMCTACRLF